MGWGKKELDLSLGFACVYKVARSSDKVSRLAILKGFWTQKWLLVSNLTSGQEALVYVSSDIVTSYTLTSSHCASSRKSLQSKQYLLLQ